MSLKNLLVEACGTFLLVLCVCLIASTGSPIAGLVIGGVLACLVYMGGPVSGGNYNPAVSLALLIRGKHDGMSFISYSVAQIVGASFGAIIFYLIFGAPFVISPAKGMGLPLVAIIEIIFTFVLCFTVLYVATTKALEGNNYFGAAIGGSLGLGAMIGGPLSGGVFNPAVAIGVFAVNIILGGSEFGLLITYILSTLLGGLIAGLLYKAFKIDEHPELLDPTHLAQIANQATTMIQQGQQVVQQVQQPMIQPQQPIQPQANAQPPFVQPSSPTPQA